MTPLHNTVDRRVLKKQLERETFKRVAVSFYRYQTINDPQAFRDKLYVTWQPLAVFGRIYVAPEGVNAQLSVPEPNWDRFKETFNSIDGFADVFLNRSPFSGDKAFIKLDVRTKPKIVADGIDEDLFASSKPAKHLDPVDFHHSLHHDNAVVVDVRNNYECETGHFKDAICPESETFREVLPELEAKLDQHREKDLMLYCTGGIRCEKASAFLKKKGFKNVYQLKGGIINYLNETKTNNLVPEFEGSMFVFDGRMAEDTIGKKLGHCYQCGKPHDIHRDCANEKCHRLILQCDACAANFRGCCCDACQKVVEETMHSSDSH